MNRFVDRPAREAVKPLGIAHFIVTSGDVNPVLVANLLFIGKGFQKQWQPGPGTAKLVEHVRNVGVTTYEDLTRSPLGWTTDDVVGAISRRLIYVDLKSERLVGYAPAHIFPSEGLATLVAEAPPLAPALPVQEGPERKPVDFSKYSDAQINAALARWSAISSVVRGDARKNTLSPTQRGWLRSYLKAVAEHGAGFVGLIPDFRQRGCRVARFDEIVEALLLMHAEFHAKDQSAGPGTTHFGNMRNACIERGVAPRHIPSRTTFHIRAAQLKAELSSIAARHGEDEAYQQTPAEPLSSNAIGRMAQRVWQLAAIDHTPLPIRCVEAIFGGKIESQLWLTYMRDVGLRRVTGVFVSWQRPCTDSVLAVLWDCLQRYGRLPESLLLDGESAHDSVRVEQLLARGTVDKIGRRYKRARDGAVIETGFSYLEHALLCHLQGNYVFKKDPKDWPRGWDPANFADRTIGSVITAVRKFFDFYNAKVPVKHLGGLTPDEASVRSLRVHGERSFRIHNDPMQARHLILPYVSRDGVRVIDRQTGVRVHGQCYLPPASRPIAPHFYGKEWHVRYDPLDIRSVLACVGGEWLELRNRHEERYADLSREQLAGASAEIIETYRRQERISVRRAEEHADMLNGLLQLSKDPLADLVNKTSAGTAPHPERLPEVDDIWQKALGVAVPAPTTFSEVP